MDYPYENLDPETFQRLAQALLTREFPNVQCFPIAQRDGGRDSVRFLRVSHMRGCVVYQVKFVRRPIDLKDAREWLRDIAAAEAAKVARLIPHGAAQFVLITNVPGTAHYQFGSIDTVQSELSTAIGIDSICWWRDDLNRRLDNAWDLKWLYPALMTGPDLIRAVLESGGIDGVGRRDAAIRTFLTHQYNADLEVKFRQIELQNRLLDLFVDVPVGPPQSDRRGRDSAQDTRVFEYVNHVMGERILNETAGASKTGVSVDRDRPHVGAASLFLSSEVQSRIPLIVLEGAPGQGKSTIAQYVCQVHRIRLLGKRADAAALPSWHRESPLRLPVKIDLRDLAAWVSGKAPFAADAEPQPQTATHRTLETFIVALIRYQSGGTEFTVSDLHATLRASALLLVLDGLDEVADIGKRRDVVDEILSGTKRLLSLAAGLQVIVTSRPAAFANSPGMPASEFVYFQLGSVDKEHVRQYTDKWARARRLQVHEAAELQRILAEKLEQPHLRDLARNPMQLAILLSLIHTRGASLPDKRTSLYDNYIDLFFSRESEKSVVVRKHRDLLVNIHRYLAWVLHTTVEEGNESGAIEETRLRRTVAEYLEQEGYDPALAGELFTGMVERVVALVSRVEGTFEFEVQPLREYFAARFLYETAPYSPPGSERRGTKPDRFDAIARNFYWFNVTRFYAGCYSKGELASLIDRLSELAIDQSYRLTSHPALLAATLLSDWVFTQHPKSVREVVRIVLGGLGLRYILNSSRRQVGNSQPLVLPDECGREQLVAHAFARLQESPPRDFALDLVDVVQSNSDPQEIFQLWRAAVNTQRDLVAWLEIGLAAGVMHQLSLDEIERLVALTDDRRGLQVFVRARRFDFCESSEDRFREAVDVILNLDAQLPHRRISHPLELLASSVSPGRFVAAWSHDSGVMPLSEHWRHMRPQYGDLGRGLEVSGASSASRYANECYAFSLAVQEAAQMPVGLWRTSIEPWDKVVECGRSLFGDRWAILVLATLAAGIQSNERHSDAGSLLDVRTPLCPRIRSARFRAGQLTWWRKQIEHIACDEDAYLLLLTAFTWAGKDTLLGLVSDLDALVLALPTVQWRRLFRALRQVTNVLHERRGRSTGDGKRRAPSHISPETAALLFARLRSPQVFDQSLVDYDGALPEVAALQLEQAVERLIMRPQPHSWDQTLLRIADAYRRGATSERFASHIVSRSATSLPLNVAEAVAAQAQRYPSFLVGLAQETCRAAVAAKIRPVGEMAREDKWFS